MFSICVPSYNSLPYLQILYGSLKRNFRLPYELIVHDNASTDDTLKWLIQNNITHTHSDTNLGFCGVNNAIKMAKFGHIFIVNSDMYIMPGCAFEIYKNMHYFESNTNKVDKYTISCTLLEPSPYNPEYNYAPFGNAAEEFDETSLLKTYSLEGQYGWRKHDTIQYSHPIVIPKLMLEEVGYLDEQYWPGWGVDHDLPASLYKKGCRNFIMLGKARVYHFSSKTFKQLSPESNRKDGQDIFLRKWGLTVNEFRSKMKIATLYQRVQDGIIS